jgi:hypothetical protein
MSSQPGTLETAALEISRVLDPLRLLLNPKDSTALLAEIGIPVTAAQANSLSGPLNNLVSKTKSTGDLAAQLVAALDDEDVAGIVSKSSEIISSIREVIDAFPTLATAIGGLGLPGVTPAVLEEIPLRLLNHLIVQYLDRNEGLNEVLEFFGVLERVEHNADSTDPNNPPHSLATFHFNKIGDWLESPSEELKAAYKWGDASFDGIRLLKVIEKFVTRVGFPVLLDETTSPPRLDAIFFEISPKTDINPKGLALDLKTQLTSGLMTFQQQDWKGEFKLDFQLPFDTQLVIQPDGNISFKPPEAADVISGQLDLKVTAARTSPSEPFVLLGQAGGSRLEIAEASLGVSPRLTWDAAAGQANGSFSVEAVVRGGKVFIDTSSGDGFLAKVLSGKKVEAGFDLTVGISSETGIYFSGSSTLEIQLPLHIGLGPIEIQSLTISVRIGAEFPINLGVDIKVGLGPLIAIVQNMGVTATLSFPPDNGGNLGPLQVDLGFKPPDGVGLSLDAGGFKGGGFLMLDSDKGEYAGALELDFNGLFSVKAIGIINTKMPDGSKGFSLLIVIAAEFTPIQLSFGFTLNGVGGIFGLNRMIVVAALAEGIRTNAVKSILFPENVIANISRIISDIKQFFPPQQDHFVLGPMAKLGWGTPSIITVELGLLLDLPDPMFAIVGVLKAVLPAEEAAILRLQVNFLGVVDFGRGYIFFRADLFDSRLLIYSITGSMAFLVSWGEAQTFALSVGGFHPDFRDLPTIPALPDGFRSMARIGISLLSDDNPRLKVESYFAVTSNTVQFGARVELYAEAAGFNVYGFLGYDVLFQFDPFRFLAKLSGGIALRRHSSVIAGVNISATLSGPTPWDARGTATLELLFFSISVGFHATWGDPPLAIASATEDLLKLLKREFADTRNWRADLPPNNHLHVSLRKIDLPAATEMLVVHPAGVLTFSQRSLPLEDFVIQKFGNKKPLAENKFKITNANSDGAVTPADFQSVREQFAPGNFLELSDSEKLSRKSFDNLPSGFKLTATSDLLTTLPVVRPVDYELSYLRREKIVPRGLVKLFVLAYERLVKGSAVRQSGLAKQQTRVSFNAPPQVGLPQETFAVANAADLKSHITTASGPVLFATQAEAYQQQQELIAQNPALAGQIQIVSHFELNPN